MQIRRALAATGVWSLLAVIFTGSFAFNAAATNHILRQDEIMAGLNGDASVQFVEIMVGGGDQKVWGPPAPGLPSRAMLIFFNGAGVEVGRFFFPNNAPVGGNSVLIATTSFAALPGAPIPDFIMPPLMNVGSGKVCFRGNPASPGAFDVNLCLSYGTFPPSQTEGAGSPAPALSITGDPVSLTRFQDFNFGQGTSQNGDFALASPTPLNTRGQTMIFPVDGPEIHTIPTTLDFGLRNIDQGPTAAQTLIITNRGVLNPLMITNLTLAGTNANEFSIIADSRQTNLPPGGTRTLTINFDPSTAGRKTASVRIICNDTNEITTDVPVLGLGFDPNAPEIDVTPLTADFGNRDIASVGSGIRPFTIANQGAIGSLVVSNIFLSGPDANEFQILTPTSSSVLAPGSTRTVTVEFNHLSVGPKNATLNIVSADTDEGVVEVSLRGRGFDLNPCTAPNPSNSVPQNACGNAQLICPTASFSGSLLGATLDGSADCAPGTLDVWYRYIPSSNGMMLITIAASPGLEGISVHSGCPGTQANVLGCAPANADADENPPNGADAVINRPVTNGVPVFIRVAGRSEEMTFDLFLDGPECVNFDRNKNGITDRCEFDFGDAPAPYPTTLAANGARHRAFTDVFLGHRIDPEDDGQPTALANGDNRQGDFNDEEGVVFTSALIPGRSASLIVRASQAGFLNAWIDFNGDGDWADAGEQVFTNRSLATLENSLTLDVPADAVITNVTFARFRFSSAPGLTFTGAAEDGEVEDYAVEILSPNPTPGGLEVRISEVLAGYNGDSTVQFVELEANGNANKGWGPQGSEPAGRAMLVFFDAAGEQTGRFVFPSNAPPGENTVLVATRAFAELTGLRPDFIMPPEIVPFGGKVAFASNPDNKHFDVQIALSYGGTEYFGKTDGAGPAHTFNLALMHAISLARFDDVPFGLNRNAAFVLSIPSPRNTAGQTGDMAAAPTAQQGRTLFSRETFRGNGRTCATCHVPGRDQFGLTPVTIDALPRSDPLFVFEDNVNKLRLIARSQPSDLRGPITGTTGRALVLSGSGDAYLVVGGTNLSGTITDGNGNRGTFQSFVEGDLEGPTLSNGSPRGLEDHTLLEHGRGLILENIDGFKAREVFRASPHLLALAFTAPFGLSGEFDSLDDFSDGAVVQHFTKSMARISGVDFRHPTREELAAMSEFMFGISNPATNALNLDRLATTEAQKRGRALFFGDEGRCSKCHSGPVLALSDGSLSGSISNKNENFNTGVANLLQNLPIGDNLPTEPAGLEPGHSTREFNTPGLFGIRLTAPFFHDGSAMTLTDAVKFYDSEEFHNSPAGVEVGSLLAANKAELVADVVAFLESLVELPVDFTRELAFGIRCPGQPLPSARAATITNLGSTTITITNVVLNGPNLNEFQIVSDSGEPNLAPGQTRQIRVAFSPSFLSVKRATLEVTAVDTNLLGSFSFGVALTAADVDNVVTAAPLSFDFGMRDIDAPPSPEDSIVITNNGSIDLDVAIELAGATPADFTMVTETNAIPAHGTRVIQLSFAPRTQGSKSAVVRVRMVSCSGTLIEIPLAGIATSTVTQFVMSSISETQFVGTPFPILVRAVDRNLDTVQNFRGTVRLQSLFNFETNTIALTPTVTDPFVNGEWTGLVTMLQPGDAILLLALDNRGHSGISRGFKAVLRDDLSVTVRDMPDPISSGEQLVYVVDVHNTGPAEATGVVLTNQLSPDVTFVSATAGQGSVSHANGVVTASIGTLVRAATVSVLITVEANPPAAAFLVTNIAIVSRSEPELNLGNNSVTNTTRIDPFGVLSVTPLDNFNASGFSGGPFAPTNQTYTLSNSGTATLSWQARSGNCAPPPGLVAWWPLNGNATDSIGNNHGTPTGDPLFTNGFVAQALLFDGIDDTIHIPASQTLDVGEGSGMTVEAWINPDDVSIERPIVEWDNGAHLWISVVSGANGGPGSVFANVVGVGPISHHVFSPPNLVAPNVWQHVAVTYTKASGIATLYLNGTVVSRTNIGSFTPLTSTELLIGRRNGGASFTGLIDEVGIFNRDLTEPEIRSIFISGTAGKCAPAPTCSPIAGAVAWWTLDGNAADRIGTNVGILSGGALFTNGFVGQALSCNGNSFVRIPASPSLNVGAGAGLTMEAWINPETVSRQQPIVEWVGPGDVGVQLWISVALPGGGPGDLFANVAEGNPPGGPFVNHKFVSPPNLVVANVWQHVALTFDTNTGRATLYFNGAVAAQQNIGSFAAFTAVDAFIGRQTFVGLIDEVGIYNRALAQGEIQSIFTAGAAGKCQSRAFGGIDCAPPRDLAGWWPFESNLDDRGRANFGVFTGSPIFTNGLVGQALFFNGGSDGVKISNTNALNVGTNDGFSFEAWVNVPNMARRNPLFEWEDGSVNAGPLLFLAADVPGSLTSEIIEVGNISHRLDSAANLFGPNLWHHVGLTYNRLTGTATLYLNGAVVRQQNVGSFTPKTTGNLFIGRRAAPGFEESFQGLIDEPSVYTRELTEAEMRSIFAAGSAGKCRARSWLAVSALAGTLAPGERTNVMFSLGTNAIRLPVGSYTETVIFTNTASQRGTTERLAMLAVLNRTPTLAGLAPIQIPEDSGPRTINLLGISAGGEIQQLTVTAFSSNPALIPNPITVNYLSPATNGSLTFASFTNAYGTSIVSVVVRDDGSTDSGARDSVTNSFLVTVTPVNDAPTVALVSDQTIAEGALLVITNIADDVDLPEDHLTFSLPGAPGGMAIDPATRVLTWRPDESQGPGTYPIRVEVSDSGTPPLRATNRFNINVLEVNESPRLIDIADRTVHEGVLVAFNALATDADLPVNAFTYTLGPIQPSGATITPSGAFSWIAADPGTHSVIVGVTDNGAPPLGDSRSFKITVVSRPLIQAITRSNNTVTLRWTAIPGARYRLVAIPKLGDPSIDWTELPGDITATADSASRTDVLNPGSQRFYKVLVLP